MSFFPYVSKKTVDVRLPKPHWLLRPESRIIKTSWVTTRLR
jgi:hypothetical protein